MWGPPPTPWSPGSGSRIAPDPVPDHEPGAFPFQAPYDAPRHDFEGDEPFLEDPLDVFAADPVAELEAKLAHRAEARPLRETDLYVDCGGYPVSLPEAPDEWLDDELLDA